MAGNASADLCQEGPNRAPVGVRVQRGQSLDTGKKLDAVADQLEPVGELCQRAVQVSGAELASKGGYFLVQ